MALSKNRERLYKKARKTKNDKDWEAAISARSEANIGMRKSKRKFIIDQIINAKGNNIKFWQTMKKIIPSDTSSQITSVFTNDSNTLVTGKTAANEINKYFCNISIDLEAKLPKQLDDDVSIRRIGNLY